MGKALKVFITLNLLLSLGIIAVGMKTFSDRNLLKAETLELEQTVAEISDDLQWGAEVPWENPDEKKAVAFTYSPPRNLQQLTNLENELDPLARFATQRQSQLTQRNNELVQTRNALEETQKTLAARESELAPLRKEDEKLQAEIEQLKTDVADDFTQINELESSKVSKTNEITNKKETLAQLNNELSVLEIDLETRIQERDIAKTEYEQCRRGAEGAQSENIGARGKKGEVLAVNNDWEYIVIDKGDANISPDFEAFIHRGGDLVGKVSVTKVEDKLAIAEVVPGTMTEGERIKPGDTLFF